MAAHEVLAAAGWDAVHERARSLAAVLADRLRGRGCRRPARGHDARRLGGSRSAARRDRLAAAGVVVRDLPGTGYLRASVGAWNDEGDLERLLAGLG